jgi:hypothetical protein
VDHHRDWFARHGGELRFGFCGLDEQIIMRVATCERSSVVEWACVSHSRGQEWTGTTVRFQLSDHGPGACDVDFRHIGISPELVADGWEHFLASLADYAARGVGTPFGA